MKKVKESLYTVTVSCLGQKVTQKGDSVLSALQTMELKNVRGRTIMVIEHNGARKERVIMPQVVMRAFNTYGITRDVSLKNIALLFTGI